jgi:hypothetical protein
MPKSLGPADITDGDFVVTLSAIERAAIVSAARRAGVSPEDWLAAAAQVPAELISTTQDLASAFRQLCELLPDLNQEAKSSVAARAAGQALAGLDEMALVHERCWGQRRKAVAETSRVRVSA